MAINKKEFKVNYLKDSNIKYARELMVGGINMSNTLNDMVFTVGETSKILKSNTNTVYKLIREGKLHALKLGRYKVPYFEIERFLRDNLGQDLSEYIC